MNVRRRTVSSLPVVSLTISLSFARNQSRVSSVLHCNPPFSLPSQITGAALNDPLKLQTFPGVGTGARPCIKVAMSERNGISSANSLMECLPDLLPSTCRRHQIKPSYSTQPLTEIGTSLSLPVTINSARVGDTLFHLIRAFSAEQRFSSTTALKPMGR